MIREDWVLKNLSFYGVTLPASKGNRRIFLLYQGVV
jgi:hypothetical protein